MKKIIKYIKKYKLIIFLAVVAGILLAIKFFITTEEEPKQAPILTPTPTITSQFPTERPISPTITPGQPTEPFGKGITEEEFVKQTLGKYPLLPHLPYEQNENIEIAYTEPLIIEITKPGAITAEDKKEVLNWIRDKGVNPNTHEIRWQVK
jgi:hypothetical protein